MDGINHVAFIMDGNGRWATAKNLPRLEGHKAGAKAMENIVSYAFSQGADVLSFYAFSTENWSRPKKEVDGILSLLMAMLTKNLPKLIKKQIKLVVSGDLSPLSSDRREKVINAIEKTKDFDKTLNILFNYGGKSDVLFAARELIRKGVENPSEKDFENALYTKDIPPVDLLIRTGGEKRLSNFMLWQTVYAELYFTDILWPDFGKDDYDLAVQWFGGRERRFGGIDNTNYR